MMGVLGYCSLSLVSIQRNPSMVPFYRLKNMKLPNGVSISTQKLVFINKQVVEKYGLEKKDKKVSWALAKKARKLNTKATKSVKRGIFLLPFFHAEGVCNGKISVKVFKKGEKVETWITNKKTIHSVVCSRIKEKTSETGITYSVNPPINDGFGLNFKFIDASWFFPASNRNKPYKHTAKFKA